MSENEDKYHDTILDLEARDKKNANVVLKIGNSLQGMFMIGPKPMSFYDSNSKHGLGYANPYSLKKAISQNPKLYDASCLDDLKIHVNVRDTEDILDDTTKNVRAQNQDLLITISELKAKLKKVEKGLSAASSVRIPLNRDSPLKNSVLSNTKKSSEKVEFSVRTNKKTYVASKNVDSNKKIVTDVDVKNALKAKDVLCVSCAKNVLIPCHDKCIANYKLNVHSKVRRALFTTPRTVKSKFQDTTPVVSKTRLSVKTTQSESLDFTSVVFRTKIAAVTPLCARNKVVQIILWIVDSGCSKHMTGQGHNLFSVGQFRDGDLEVSFRSNTCYVQNLEGDDLLTRARESNLYTISILDMAASSPVCLLSKATSTKSWLWHHRLLHLNFGTINDLTKHDLVVGLPKFKYSKDHLCFICERGKSKKSSHPPKVVPSNHSKLELLHMDLFGPMRVASINGKKHILVIVDDYSRYT
ncbi:integrase, catalytic region, zinc finger, CCHC-type containing protein [Tanacetum coccineum]|uniref:Integrase, catalytic region, zinc finger, CCHC-type containing protein n=1 Tax=Tanacetum coccineum TaxID=301880 RepID=A0ABQ5CTB4_9ASTR